MSVVITQTCDGCKAEREIRFGYANQPRDLDGARRESGWLIAKTFRDLCNKCVSAAVGATS